MVLYSRQGLLYQWGVDLLITLYGHSRASEMKCLSWVISDVPTPFRIITNSHSWGQFGILYQFEIVPYDKDCPYDKEVLRIPIKIDSFYDCENLENDKLDELDELDEDMCQNKISSSFICCQKDCCENNVYINQKTCRTKNISNIERISLNKY